MLRHLTVALVLIGTSVAAQECREIDNDLDRLACYDKQSGRTPIVSNVESEIESDWKVRIQTSEMTDDANVFLTTVAKDPVYCGSIYGSERPTLYVRCVENTTAIVLSTHCHVVSSDYNDYGDITYRLDDKPAITKSFDESTNNRALGLWRGGRAIPFAKAMFNHDQILMRFRPYGENAVTARFDISGLKEEIAPLREACGW